MLVDWGGTGGRQVHSGSSRFTRARLGNIVFIRDNQGSFGRE